MHCLLFVSRGYEGLCVQNLLDSWAEYLLISKRGEKDMNEQEKGNGERLVVMVRHSSELRKSLDGEVRFLAGKDVVILSSPRKLGENYYVDVELTKKRKISLCCKLLYLSRKLCKEWGIPYIPETIRPTKTVNNEQQTAAV